jgi:hypothetical protein
MYMLINMHHSSAQGSFCPGLGGSVKSCIVEDHSGFLDKPEWRTGVPLSDTCGNGKIGFYFSSPELSRSEYLYQAETGGGGLSASREENYT